MSRVRNAPGYKPCDGHRLQLIRWLTRGGVPASTIGFHRPTVQMMADPFASAPEGERVQGAMTVVFKLTK